MNGRTSTAAATASRSARARASARSARRGCTCRPRRRGRRDSASRPRSRGTRRPARRPAGSSRSPPRPRRAARHRGAAFGERPQRGEIRHERALHVRDPETVDPALANESFRPEPGDTGQPRLAAGVRGIHVAVEHQSRPTARARPGREHVRASVLDLLPLHRKAELLALPGHPGRHGLLRAGEARDRTAASASATRRSRSITGRALPCRATRQPEEARASSEDRPRARPGSHRPGHPRARTRAPASPRPRSSMSNPRCRRARAPARAAPTWGFEKPSFRPHAIRAPTAARAPIPDHAVSLALVVRAQIDEYRPRGCARMRLSGPVAANAVRASASSSATPLTASAPSRA